MWSRIGRRLGLYGPPAPETEPIASIENAGIPSPQPEIEGGQNACKQGLGAEGGHIPDREAILPRES